MMMTRRQAALAVTGAMAGWAATEKSQSAGGVQIKRIPSRGIQPQLASDDKGHLHLVYYTGDAHGGDLHYVQSADGASSFSAPLQVNTQSGSAIAAGTIRGAQLALGRSGRVHVAWNGSNSAKPEGPVNPDSGKPGAPMLYTRLDAAGKAFEAQRGLMRHSFGLDGGGSIAADAAGNVYVTWHGIGESDASRKGVEGEARRRVWLTKSTDDGASFQRERMAWSEPTGACGCCGMKTYVDRHGTISALYRSATQSVHRDIYLLRSGDRAQSFKGSLVHKWEINACPMSSMDIHDNGKFMVGAWETGGQIYWARLGSDGLATQPVAAPGDVKGRKHPRIAINQNGELLLVWTEGTGWQKGGSLAWQLYDPSGKPSAEKRQMPGVPVWSFAAVAARPDNSFVVLY